MKNKTKEIDTLFGEINRKLLPKHKGKIVALDVDSGSYFIGDSELDAYKKAIKQSPNKQFVFKRVGFNSTHFVGAL